MKPQQYDHGTQNQITADWPFARSALTNTTSGKVSLLQRPLLHTWDMTLELSWSQLKNRLSGWNGVFKLGLSVRVTPVYQRARVGWAVRMDGIDLFPQWQPKPISHPQPADFNTRFQGKSCRLDTSTLPSRPPWKLPMRPLSKSVTSSLQG